MGGGDDAHVGLDRRATTDGRVFALLEHAQQAGLRLERHVADLVEEQRAALGLLEAALRALLRAGEGALLVAEQLALDQLAGDRGQLSATNGPCGAGPLSCRTRATSSLPVPDSPAIMTVRSVWVSRARTR